MNISQYLKKLYSYSFEWFQKKLINKEELDTIICYIEGRQEEIKPDRQVLFKRIVILLYSLGLILILAGVVYFIAANWDGMHKFVRLAIILFGMGLFYGVGFLIKLKFPGFPVLNKLLTFGGTFFFGIALALVGQIYNIHANSASLFFIWFIPCFILAFVTGFEPYFSLSAILINLSLFFYFFPVSNLWIMIPYNWIQGFSVLILMNLIFFLIRSLNKKAEKGNSFLYIPYVLLHFYGYFVSFKFLSKDAVFIVNIVYVLVIGGCFFYLIKYDKNNFLSYYTLVMAIIYLITKYFEIIINIEIDYGLSTGFLLVMIILGLVIIPVSIFLSRILVTYVRDNK